MTSIDPTSGPLRTVPIGAAGDLTVTADRYEDDPAVVAVLDAQSVAHEFTPDVARALGRLLIAGADAAHAWTAMPS
jgi:hypothetical protein